MVVADCCRTLLDPYVVHTNARGFQHVVARLFSFSRFGLFRLITGSPLCLFGIASGDGLVPLSRCRRYLSRWCGALPSFYHTYLVASFFKC